MSSRVIWPQGKDFAFTVFDDTDLSTLENVRGVYSLLADNGFRTTKSVWPIRGNMEPDIGGATCQDRDYLKWVIALKNLGFEIGYHNATFHTSLRDETARAIEIFKEVVGYYPKSMANHSQNKESIYWGNYRLTGMNESIYNLITRNRHKGRFRGHLDGDPHFWGDVCEEKIKYVRNFVFLDINTMKTCPIMPYHDAERPYVHYWFASSDGPDVETFNHRIREENQDRLEKEGGACIIYTHFACGFYQNKSIDSRFQFLLKRLARKNGWFVPVSTLLDYLLGVKGQHNITQKERARLERKWLWHRIRMGIRQFSEG